MNFCKNSIWMESKFIFRQLPLFQWHFQNTTETFTWNKPTVWKKLSPVEINISLCTWQLAKETKVICHVVFTHSSNTIFITSSHPWCEVKMMTPQNVAGIQHLTLIFKTINILVPRKNVTKILWTKRKLMWWCALSSVSPCEDAFTCQNTLFQG